MRGKHGRHIRLNLEMSVNSNSTAKVKQYHKRERSQGI